MSRALPLLHTDALVIRRAYPEDARTLTRLAALDSRRPLTGQALVAERGGEVLAALSLEDGRAVADPFAPTADLVGLLRLHAVPVTAGRRGRRDLLRWRGADLRRPAALARG